MKKLFFIFAVAVAFLACEKPNNGENGGGENTPSLVTAISVSRPTLQLAVGDSVRLSYTLTPADAVASVEWSSSNEAVATVDKRGIVRAVSSGSAVVSVSCGEYKSECQVTVKSFLETLHFTGAAPLGEPDITYNGGQLYHTVMGKDSVHVYLALATFVLFPEGTFLDVSGNITATSEKSAVILVQVPVAYGTPEHNNGRTVANFEREFKIVDPYKGAQNTIEPGTINQSAYLDAFRSYCEAQNQQDEMGWKGAILTASECVSGARLTLLEYRSDMHQYAINDMPEGLVVAGSFKLNKKTGLNEMMFGLDALSLTVKPLDRTNYVWGTAVTQGSDGFYLADEDIHFLPEITYTK